MHSFDKPEQAYNWCVAEGQMIRQKEVGYDRVAANLAIAEEYLESAQEDIKKGRWNSTYTLHYDALHLLVESFLLFDHIKSRSHLCLFAYLCNQYPDMELDWGFFEKVRTKRNGLSYYGTPVAEKHWKEVALQFQLYLKLLKKKLQERLKPVLKMK